jgi:hypothetical protein
MLHAGKKIGQDSKNGAFTLTGADVFPGGLNTVSVTLSPQRPGCDPSSTTFRVEPCDPGDGQQNPAVSHPDDGDESGGCIFGRIAVTLLFATAIFLTLLAICLFSFPLWIAAGVAWVLAFIVLGLWSAFCGTRCGSMLISWQSALLGAWLAAYMMGCCPWAVVALIALAAAAASFFALWVAQCRPTSCRVIVELLWVTAVPAAMMLAVLAKLLPCGILTGVLTVNSVVAAALTVAVLPACKPK